MQIPEQDQIAELIDRHHEELQGDPRPHLGASMLGHPCDRWLWLSFRWAVVEKFNGRMLRLFRRGHNEEAQIISDLRAIGLDVRTPSAGQSRVDFGFHVSGSLDGIIESGVPGAPKAKAVLECKTHSDKSFKELKAKGVKEAKPMHWVQCCVYGYGAKLDRALYFAVNKNTDEIYTEWLHLDKEVAEKAIARGQRITQSDRMPEPLSTNPTWHDCRYCPAHNFCHKSKTTKEVNCRTCAHASALPDSTWHCARWDDLIPVEAQREGCESHVLHPDMVPWERRESASEWQAVYIVKGKPIANGAPGEGVYSSKELLANAEACGNAEVNEVRAQWSTARVVG